MKNSRRITLTAAACLLLLLAAAIFSAVSFLKENYSYVTLESVIFMLKVPLEKTESGLVLLGAKTFLKYLAAFFAVYVIISVNPFGNQTFLVLGRAGRERRIAWWPANKTVSLILSAALFISSLIYAGRQFSFADFIRNSLNTSTIYEDCYAEPSSVTLTFPEKKRNLIFIFLESMEVSYLGEELGGIGRENLIPELYDLAAENINFSQSDGVGGAYTAVDTGWTIAAMVGASAGIPLSVPLDGNAYRGYTSFLPGALSLGDILKAQDYNLSLLVGSDAEFGGRSYYYAHHGDYKILDYYTAQQDGIISEGYRVWWGFEDMHLYEYAKKELTRLSSLDEPFALTMLTVDTHHVGGYVCSLCGDSYEKQYSNVIACSSRQVGYFIDWIKRQDFYDDTAVIIMGDHPSMDAAYFAGTPKDYVRRTFNVFINSAVQTAYDKNREFTIFDIYPSTLAAMGVKTDGEKLALGVNLFSGEQTLAERFGVSELNRLLALRSDYYVKNILYADG